MFTKSFCEFVNSKSFNEAEFLKDTNGVIKKGVDALEFLPDVAICEETHFEIKAQYTKSGLPEVLRAKNYYLS